MKLWVKKAKGKPVNTGRFKALMTNDEGEGNQGFARLGEDWV